MFCPVMERDIIDSFHCVHVSDHIHLRIVLQSDTVNVWCKKVIYYAIFWSLVNTFMTRITPYELTFS